MISLYPLQTICAETNNVLPFVFMSMRVTNLEQFVQSCRKLGLHFSNGTRLMIYLILSKLERLRKQTKTTHNAYRRDGHRGLAGEGQTGSVKNEDIAMPAISGNLDGGPQDWHKISCVLLVV